MSKTKERYFPITIRPKSKKAMKGSQITANSRIKNKSVICEECKSDNCKQRTFDIKCYNCGVVY